MTNLKLLNKTTECLGYDCRYSVRDKNEHNPITYVETIYCTKLPRVHTVL